MVIKDNRDKTKYKTISDYQAGDVFEYDAMFFMKVSSIFNIKENVVNLTTGDLYEFDETDPLTDINIELIIRD